MYTVRFTRSAIQGIQRYPDVIDAVTRFREGHFGEHKALRGSDKLLRTRRGDYRIIWTRIYENTILVVKVGDRKDIYKSGLGSCEPALEEMEPEELSWADLGIEVTKVEDLPTYKLPPATSSLRQFFYGTYLNSPCLTKEQEQLLSVVIDSLSSPSEKINSLLIQSAPGTGKTVCATLLACDLYENYGLNIILILPEILCKDIQEYERIKQIAKRQNNENFFIGSLDQWIESMNSALFSQIATIEEQKIALEKEAKRIHLTDIDMNDLKLYTSFIYAIDENVINHENRIPYKQNCKRIEQLKKISKQKFLQNLNSKVLRVDVLEELSQKLSPEQVTSASATVFIMDEAQDYLLKEIKSIASMLNRWRNNHCHPSLLWLLGDVNQRIQPVDFDWGDLHLNRHYPLKYNYRNTRKIIEFANIFNQISKQITKENRTSYLPPSSDPESAFEEGEPVKVLEVSGINDVKKFLNELSQRLDTSVDSSKANVKNPERYLLRDLANQAYVIFMNEQDIPHRNHQLPGINCLSVSDAKGREFNGCIVVSLGHDKKGFSLIEANNWYTAATRARQRLLLILTPSEVESIGREKLQGCEFFRESDHKVNLPVTWMAQSSNAESALKDFGKLVDMITNQVPDLYYDTYSALHLAKASDEKIYEVEYTLISKLKRYNKSFLENQLEEFQAIPDIDDQVGLRCLILRALDRSWDAVAEVSKIKKLHPEQYHRILNAIATDLEAKGLPYEAARVRAKVHGQFPKDYPFAESFPIDDDSPLVSILCKLAIKQLESEVSHGTQT